MNSTDEAPEGITTKSRYALGEEIKAHHVEIEQSYPAIEHLRATWQHAHLHHSQVANPEEKRIIATQIELMRPGIEQAEQEHGAFHAGHMDGIHAIEAELKRRDDVEEAARKKRDEEEARKKKGLL